MIFWHFGWIKCETCVPTSQKQQITSFLVLASFGRRAQIQLFFLVFLEQPLPTLNMGVSVIIVPYCPYSIEKRPCLQVPGDTWTLAMACLLCAADLHVPWWIRPRRATHAVYGKGRCDIDRVVQSLCWVDPHEIMNTDCLTLIILI